MTINELQDKPVWQMTAETVLQITKDCVLPEWSIVALAIICSKPFDKFASHSPRLTKRSVFQS